MKRNTLPLLALGASLLTGGYLLGQNNKAAAPAAAPKATKLVHVATIAGAAANQEFQRNVQVLQAQRTRAQELDAAMQKEKDAKKKAELKGELDRAVKQLEENNQKMHKAYGFTLLRNYTMEIETSKIYMEVTEEEAAKIEKEAKAEKAGSAKAKK